MGLRDQKLSKRQSRETVNAMQLFTDREDPQEAFERKLAIINEFRHDASGVICYYGIGGIGKTSLRIKLCHLINGDPECKWIFPKTDCDYAVFDFGEDGITKDPKTVLLRIKEQLEKRGYSFYLFDMAMLLYAQKVGDQYDKEKTESFIDKSPFAKLAVSAIGAVPVVSWVSDIVQLIDQAATGVKQILDDKSKKIYKEEFTRLHGMEATEIYDRFHEYFIKDMQMNMAKAKKPLVIFIDTYEKYVDTLNSDTIDIISDHWLWKGPQSVIQAIPGVLWVFLGRERLEWDKGDEHWRINMPEKPLHEMNPEDKENLANENIEQHLLGDLSEKDTLTYMKKAGVDDEKLCHDLYQNITKGTPLFIHICIEQYKNIIETRTPKLEDFGNDISELVTRYLKNMPDYYKEMSFFLAILGTWTDEMAFDIAPKINCMKGFNEARYRDYVEHSFVIKKIDGTQYIHEVVKKAYLKNAGKEITGEVRKALDEWLFDKMQNDRSVDQADSVGRYIDSLIQMDLSYDDLYERWDDIHKKCENIKKMYDFKRLILMCEKLYEYVKATFSSSKLEMVVAAALSEYYCRIGNINKGRELVDKYFPDNFNFAHCNDKNIYSMYFSVGNVQYYAGRYLKAKEYDEEAYKGLLQILGENHPDTIWALNSLAIDYSNLGDYTKSAKMKEQVYEKRKRILEEDHPDTISALNNLAIAYRVLGDYTKSKNMHEQVYEKRKRILEEDHPDTIRALQNLATDYSYLGEYTKSKELAEQVYEKRKRILGEDHPDTISALQNLATDYSYLGEYTKSKDMDEQVYEKCKRILGEDHPDTISALQNLAIDYSYLGEYTKSKELAEQVYEKRKRILG